MLVNEKPIIVEETFNSSTESVWEAITKIDKMHEWYFENIPSFKAEVGFETEFEIQSGNRRFNHIWKVTEVIPYKMIKYNWKYSNYKGDSAVIFEILTENNTTKLRLTTEILKNFPEHIPEFSRESCKAGWNYFIKIRLKSFLENIRK